MYFALPTYQGISVDELYQDLKEMVSLVESHNPEECYFFDYEAFLKIPLVDGKSLYDSLFCIDDKQFIYQVFFSAIEKIRTFSTTTNVESNSVYCFWGHTFSKTLNYCFSIVPNYIQYRDKVLMDALNGDNFFDLKGCLFPSLVFSETIVDNLKALNGDELEAIKDGLHKLEIISFNWKNNIKCIIDSFRDLGNTFSGESQSTNGNKKCVLERTFRFEGKGSVYCERHLKVNKRLRIHIDTDNDNRVLMIGYAGHHLSTSRIKP